MRLVWRDDADHFEETIGFVWGDFSGHFGETEGLFEETIRPL